MAGPLSHIRVLDLSRIMAGPWATQVLADLGADVIKVERPGVGDDTRTWGPPFLKDAYGQPTKEAGYYLSVNRGKRSITLELDKPEGQAVVRALAARSDIVLENFKVGTLRRFALDYESLKAVNPRIIYCSVTGFGQTGPKREAAAYDFMIQAMGGLMSITGEPDREPMKVGVAVTDLFAGQNAVIAILAALQARTQTGKGQHLDISLFDSQVGMLANVASNYLIAGSLPQRYGNAHANIVPYQSFQARDAWFVIAVGNDKQFARLCEITGKSELAQDSHFVTNSGRVEHRDELIALLKPVFLEKTSSEWLSVLEGAGIPCGPLNTFDKVFAEPQVEAREMLIHMEHPEIGDLTLVGSPLKFSETPVEYRLPPPRLGEYTEEILTDRLGYSNTRIQELLKNKVIA